MIRRDFLLGLGAILAAPAVIRTPGLLMPVRRLAQVGTTIYVSSSAAATGADGSRERPFRDLHAAIACASAHRGRASIHIASGAFLLNEPVRLEGLDVGEAAILHAPQPFGSRIDRLNVAGVVSTLGAGMRAFGGEVRVGPGGLFL